MARQCSIFLSRWLFMSIKKGKERVDGGKKKLRKVNYN